MVKPMAASLKSLRQASTRMTNKLRQKGIAGMRWHVLGERDRETLHYAVLDTSWPMLLLLMVRGRGRRAAGARARAVAHLHL